VNPNLNVLGTPLEPCSLDPMTGFYRTGCCDTGPQDRGRHLICAQVTQAFLEFTQAQGNDLSTPAPHYDFPGLKPGDRWCLCVSRWQEAWTAGVAPPCYLRSHPYGHTQRYSLRNLKGSQATITSPLNYLSLKNIHHCICPELEMYRKTQYLEGSNG